MNSPFLEIPEADWLLSNEAAFAINDRYPVSLGHSLVITRRLVVDWDVASRKERQAMMELAGDVMDLIRRQHDPDGFNVGFNTGVAAGQTVFHVHLHVIPRYEGDVEDPRGGVRHVVPGKGNYLAD